MIDVNLKIVIEDYLQEVEHAVMLFKDIIGDKNPLKAWKDNDIPQKGKLTEGVEYEFHGIGCVLIYKNHEIDFDFGPEGRYDGFDLWRLTQFIESRAEKYPRYQDKDVLKGDFEKCR